MRNAGNSSEVRVKHAPGTMRPAYSARTKPSFSFRGLIVLLYASSLVLSLVGIGLLAFRLERAYLLGQAQSRLIGFIQAGVARYTGGPELNGLAVDLAGDLQVLGADMFIQNARGDLVQPTLGAHSWLGPADHQATRDQLQSKMQVIDGGSSPRLVYLTPIVDPTGAVLGSIEASLPVLAISQPLNSLRRGITAIVVITAGLSMLLAVFLSILITRPIQRMVAAIENYNEGDLQARAPLSSVSELRRLGIAYNRMLDWMSEDVRNQIRRTEDAPSDSRN